jgi:hypothetical protein
MTTMKDNLSTPYLSLELNVTPIWSESESLISAPQKPESESELSIPTPAKIGVGSSFRLRPQLLLRLRSHGQLL